MRWPWNNYFADQVAVYPKAERTGPGAGGEQGWGRGTGYRLRSTSCPLVHCVPRLGPAASVGAQRRARAHRLLPAWEPPAQRPLRPPAAVPAALPPSAQAEGPRGSRCHCLRKGDPCPKSCARGPQSPHPGEGRRPRQRLHLPCAQWVLPSPWGSHGVPRTPGAPGRLRPKPWLYPGLCWAASLPGNFSERGETPPPEMWASERWQRPGLA